MLQLSIIAFLALVLIIVLAILLKQAFKQRRLMRKKKPADTDIREQEWVRDFKNSYFKSK